MKNNSVRVYLMAAVFATMSVTANPWKYFTAAYWLPYTCGDALNKKPKVFVDDTRVPFMGSTQVKKYTMDTFIRILSVKDLGLLFTSKDQVEKEIQRLKPKSVFDSGYWLPYTNGRKFDIEKLEEIKAKFKP